MSTLPISMGNSQRPMFLFPLLAVGITPILGKFVDYKGKAASMLVIGSLLLIACQGEDSRVIQHAKQCHKPEACAAENLAEVAHTLTIFPASTNSASRLSMKACPHPPNSRP